MDTLNVKTYLLIILFALLSGCGGGDNDSRSADRPSDFDPPPPEPKEPINLGGNGNLYEADRLMVVDIQMPASEYNQLRVEGRTLASTFRSCVPEYEYTEFVSSVTIDGDTMHDVIIRKKGYLGSLSAVRPSFKLDLNDLHKGRTYQNSNRLTLNNNRQDPSNVRQCLSYSLFRAAGLPAPQCNYAKITVNGNALGIYSNVEPIKKPFLEREFNNKDGNLYEGQRADLGQHLHLRLELKNNEDSNDRSDVLTLSEALKLSDQELITSLPRLLDVNEFIRFWALETLIGFWDSATGFSNNYHLYHSSSDDLFHYIPWGPDNAFTQHFFFPNTGPLYHNSQLTNRLFSIDSYREQYIATINEYLNTLWNEEALNEQIDAIQLLTNTDDAGLSSLRNFINGIGEEGDNDYRPSQRQRLVSAINGDITQADPTLLEDEPLICTTPTSINFAANASSLNDIENGSFTLTHPNRGAVFASIDAAATVTDAIIYNLDKTTNPNLVSVALVGADFNDAYRPYVLSLLVEEPNYKPGIHPLHGFASAVFLYDVDPEDDTNLIPIAVAGEGQVEIFSTGPEQGDTSLQVTGKLEFLSYE